MPCYGGKIFLETVESLLELQREDYFSREGVVIDFDINLKSNLRGGHVSFIAKVNLSQKLFQGVSLIRPVVTDALLDHIIKMNGTINLFFNLHGRS